MHKPGRNEVCACGSGHKYKRCCMGREASRAAFAADVDRRALPVLSELAGFAERNAGAALDAIARRYFPYWTAPLDDRQATRALDFLMFDMRLEGIGGRAIDEFIIERGDGAAAEERAMLTAWSQALRALYVVESWSGGFVTCIDALDDEPRRIEVLPLRGDGPLAKGRPIALRPMECAGGFFCIGSPLEFGEQNADDVIAEVKRRHFDYVRNRRIAGVADYLRFEPTALDEVAARGRKRSVIVIPGA